MRKSVTSMVQSSAPRPFPLRSAARNILMRGAGIFFSSPSTYSHSNTLGRKPWEEVPTWSNTKTCKGAGDSAPTAWRDGSRRRGAQESEGREIMLALTQILKETPWLVRISCLEGLRETSHSQIKAHIWSLGFLLPPSLDLIQE